MRRRAFLSVAIFAGLLAALVATSFSTAAPPGVTKAADLFAGKTTDVGDVYVWNDATNLYVEIDLTGSYCMTESHVAVASNLAGIPQVNGNPPPGQFPYGDDYSPCATTDTFTIPLAGLGSSPVIAVHAKVSSQDTLSLVSDTSTMVTSFNGVAEGPNPAVAAFEPVGYPDCGQYVQSPVTGSVWDTQTGGSASNDAGGPFAGATWIWRSANPAFPDVGEYATFERTFNVPGTPTGGSILITADNGYQVSLNGTLLGSAQITAPPFPADLSEAGVNTTNWQSPETWVLPLQGGINTLSIVAANEAAYPDFPNIQTTGVGGVAGGVCPNPGGLIFKAEASYLAGSDSGWAGTAPLTQPFPGKNWATYFTFDLQDVLVETVTVPAALPNGPAGATSATVLASGTNYLFKVTGTVTWTNRNGNDLVDAECTLESGAADWAQNAAGYPDDLLELQVNGDEVDWGPVAPANSDGCADPGHEYTLAFLGAGSTVNFRIYDGTGNLQDVGWFGDNAGSLTVQIWKTF
jgi:hypothetical protein